MGRQGAAQPWPFPNPTATKVPCGDRSGRFKQLAQLEKTMSFPHNLLTPEEIFHAYASRVYSLALRMLGNTADAEAVTQEVLRQAVRKRGTFRGKSSLTTWLYRATVNAALARRRCCARCKDRPAGQSDQVCANDAHAGAQRPVASPETRLKGEELRQHLEGAIARLPEMYRDVFVLADVEELPNAEIGRLLGLSLAAVKSRLHRARLALGEALSHHLAQ
jgi:RNA polymerase sigma-70 factor (ECF subfamily)